MMTTISSRQEIQVALNLPESIGGLIIKAKSIEKAMTGNAYFTASATQVTDLGKAIDNLVKSEAGFNNTPPSVSKESRDGYKIEVRIILKKLRGDVQDVVDANPTTALEIIASASMDYKRKAYKPKRQNDAVNGDEEGTVVLTAAGAGPHQWRMSLDQKEWTSITPTRTSQTTVKDLTPGVVYYFQNKPILSEKDTTDWSQIIKLRIA